MFTCSTAPHHGAQWASNLVSSLNSRVESFISTLPAEERSPVCEVGMSLSICLFIYAKMQKLNCPAKQLDLLLSVVQCGIAVIRIV